MHDDLDTAALGIAAEFVAKKERLAKVMPSGLIAAYPDPNWGWKVPTIGWGTTRYRNGEKVKPTDIITREQAAEELVYFLHDKALAVLRNRVPTWGRMSANQRAALLSFSYNLGPYWYGVPKRASITAVCDTTERWHDRPWIMEQFAKYCNPGSRSESGLRKRRLAEAELFLKE